MQFQSFITREIRDAFDFRMCGEIRNIIEGTWDVLEKAYSETPYDKQAFTRNLVENCVSPGNAQFEACDSRIQKFSNLMTEDSNSLILNMHDFSNLITQGYLDKDLLKKVVRCASISLIKNFVSQSDEINPKLVDDLID